MNLKEIKSEDLIFSNDIEDDRTNTYLNLYDYDWMDYNVWHYKELDDFGAWLTSENISDIKNIIVDLLTNDEKKEARIAAKKVLWRNQGKGAEKVVDYMMGESNNELKN